MCGGVVPPYANAETETWSYPCVPPPALNIYFRSECSWGLLGYILARGMDVWRRGASIREYGNGNVELPQRATSSLTR